LVSIERKAATKELRRLTTRQRELGASDPKAATQLTRKIHEAQVSVNYTIYYPLSEKYVSLYPHDKKRKKKKSSSDIEDAEDEEEEEEETDKIDEEENDLLVSGPIGEKPPMWHTVEKCTADNTLDLLRDGKLKIGADGKPKGESLSEMPAAITKPNKKAAQGSMSTKNHQSDKRRSREDRPRRSEPAPQPESEPMDQDDDESDGGFFEE
jgi:hypothetical protein